MKVPNCRLCNFPLQHNFIDLGLMPLPNALVDARETHRPEKLYPLQAFVCGNCFLVQIGEWVEPEVLFGDYPYFSSFSDSWLRHAEAFATTMMDRYHLTDGKQVVEVASNDGYLLQFFAKKKVRVLGVEPAKNVAKVAQQKGIPTLVAFFGVPAAQRVLREYGGADLLVGNNVLAHVPDLHDFVEGLRSLLKPDGILSMEFPHLLRLIEETQFDTIHHEHFSYFSLLTSQKLLAEHGLTIFDVEEMPTHGGSLRVFARLTAAHSPGVEERVASLKERELRAGLQNMETYAAFAGRVQEVKRSLLKFLHQAKHSGKSVAAYGAPAKGAVLLNYCGVGTDFIDYTVDRSPQKTGFRMPGTGIPIYPVERLRETRPDFLLILPWNLKKEIMETVGWIREWGGKFVLPIPKLEVVE